MIPWHGLLFLYYYRVIYSILCIHTAGYNKHNMRNVNIKHLVCTWSPIGVSVYTTHFQERYYFMNCIRSKCSCYCNTNQTGIVYYRIIRSQHLFTDSLSFFAGVNTYYDGTFPVQPRAVSYHIWKKQVKTRL